MMILIASEKSWNKDLVDRLNKWSNDFTFNLINSKEGLNAESIRALDPQKIFFPHWSHIIPKEIHENYECVVFHMTDLPYGRGGSPLQNLIVRGHKETKLSALKVDQGLDTGPIYLKKPLSLEGTAEEIFKRTDSIIEEMIKEILIENLQPVPQDGEPVVFKRRRAEDGCMNDIADLNTIFDYIRMLDAPGYPKAYIEVGDLKIEFTDAQNNGDNIKANVRITKK